MQSFSRLSCTYLLKMFFVLFLSSCIVSGFCRDLSELKHPSFNAETYLDQNVDGIIGGEEASIEDHPHQVALISKKKGFFCGGFIVSENYILTAAHCVVYLTPGTDTATAGSAFHNGTVIQIAEVTSHPDYDKGSLNKDVAVLKTAAPIEFNDVIKAIPLPKKGRKMEQGTDVVVSGWGSLNWPEYPTPAEFPDHLMAVQVKVIDYDQCQKSYPEWMTENMFCAGNYEEGGIGACKGDSGGPVTQDGMVVGVVSFSIMCAKPYYPTVYVDLAAPAIRDFITEHTGL